MEETIRFGTYNIRMDTPRDDLDIWSNRSERVLELIKDYNFDILGLQEVKETQKKDLSSLDDYVMVGQGRFDDESNEYNTLMFKKDKFELIEEETIWLSLTPWTMSKADEWGAACPRVCTSVLLRIKESGVVVRVANTHLDHVGEEARYQSALLILSRYFNKLNDYPFILMGDFNGGVEERFYKALTKEMTNTLDVSPHHVGPYITCTSVGFKHDISWDDMVRIDHVFIRNGIKVKLRVVKSTVITDKFSGRYPSDHFPVMVDVQI